jgi:hypothetical protein
VSVRRDSNHQLDYIGHDVNNPDGSVTHYEIPLSGPTTTDAERRARIVQINAELADIRRKMQEEGR